MEHLPRRAQGLPRQAGRVAPAGPATTSAPTPYEVVALLAEDDRLRALSAVVLGAVSIEEVSAAAGMDRRGAARALARLESGGLVVAEGGRYRAATALIKAAAREARPEPDAGDGTADPVLRAFVRDGRLVSIPATRGKRLVVLDHLAQRFEPGRRYEERQVNEVLAAFHPDYAALRRHLVDEGFLERESGGAYWRSGGTFDVD